MTLTAAVASTLPKSSAAVRFASDTDSYTWGAWYIISLLVAILIAAVVTDIGRKKGICRSVACRLQALWLEGFRARETAAMPPACAAKQFFVPNVGMMEECSCPEAEKDPKTRRYTAVPGEVYYRCFECQKPVDKFLPQQRPKPRPKTSLPREQGETLNALSLETLKPQRSPPSRPAGSYLTGAVRDRMQAAERDEEVARGAAGPAGDVFPPRRSRMEIEGRDREVAEWCWTPTSLGGSV